MSPAPSSSTDFWRWKAPHFTLLLAVLTAIAGAGSAYWHAAQDREMTIGDHESRIRALEKARVVDEDAQAEWQRSVTQMLLEIQRSIGQLEGRLPPVRRGDLAVPQTDRNQQRDG